MRYMIFSACICAFAILSCQQKREVTITGRFVIDATGKSYGGFGYTLPIGVNCKLSDGKEISAWDMQIDADGRFRTTKVPASVRSITFTSNNFRKGPVAALGPINIPATTGSSVDLGEIALPVSQLVRVRVYGPDGKGLKGIDVRLTTEKPEWRDRLSKTDQNGEYVFGGYEPGPSTISANAYSKDGHAWVGTGGVSTAKKEIEITSGSITDVRLDFEAKKTSQE